MQLLFPADIDIGIGFFRIFNIRITENFRKYPNTRLIVGPHFFCLFFGKNIERFLPGAYIQYVRFAGQGRASEVKSEYKFEGNLCKVLYQLDTFVDTAITNRRPVPVSALREKTVMDYPHWATRELLMNAVCHRTYESNGPIQFYQYDDRIEIMNPGGLYGKVNAENFPLVNDYRNPIVAETMKVLGFVNRFSRGVLRVEEELKENGNGKPEFSLNLGTAFMVIEHISSSSSESVNEEKSEENGKKNDNSHNTSHINSEGKAEEKSEEKESLTDTERNILQLLSVNPNATYAFISDNLGIGETSVYNCIRTLKKRGWLKRENGRKYGKWVVLKTLEMQTI